MYTYIIWCQLYIINYKYHDLMERNDAPNTKHKFKKTKVKQKQNYS